MVGEDRRVRSVGAASMTRREMMMAMVASGMIPAVGASCVAPVSPPGPPPSAFDPGMFPDGVMAGDPRPDGSVIWSRVLVPAHLTNVDVAWMVGEDPSFESVAVAGVVGATAGTDFTVKVLVDGLDSNRWYWYRFETEGGVSRTGKLRTSPAPGDRVDHLRFAFASCQQIGSESWFVAHKRMAEENLDFVMHLGDYVYVSDGGTVSLEDYRSAYRRWHKEPLLRDLHAEVPIVAMWDDGEFANEVDRDFPEPRFTNAKQAWFDYFPVLDPGGLEPQRQFGWGSLADVFMMDVRAHRTAPEFDQAWEPTQTTLGADQFAWLTEGLASSETDWRVIGNPYNLNVWKLLDLEWLRGLDPDLPPDAGVYAPNEAWDNYARERSDLLRFLVDNGVSDTAFCSGHTHIPMAANLRGGVGEPIAATDVVAGSLTADPDIRKSYFGELPVEAAEAVIGIGEEWIVGQNHDMKYVNLIDQGWVTVDVTPEAMVFSIRRVDTAHENAEAHTIAEFRVDRGTPGLKRVRSSSRGAFG